MGDIVDRLRASVRMGAYNGDAMERGVCGKQMVEAATEIKRLRNERDDAIALVDELAWALLADPSEDLVRWDAAVDWAVKHNAAQEVER